MIRRCHRPEKEGPQHHAQSPPEERRRRPVEPERVDRHRRPDRPRRRRLRRQRVRPHRPAPAPAQGRLPPAAGDDRAGRAARPGAGRPGRHGDEGLGPREGRHPLHPLVPAADGLHGREARLLLRAGGRRHGPGPVQRQGADQGRAGRVELPDGRHPGDLRGAWLHGVGPHQPRLHHGEPQRGLPLHPDGLRVVDGRGAGHQDPAPALDGGAEQVGAARAGAVRRPHGEPRLHDDRPRAGVLPDRRDVLLRAPGPGQHRPHPVRRQAAQGP